MKITNNKIIWIYLEKEGIFIREIVFKKVTILFICLILFREKNKIRLNNGNIFVYFKSQDFRNNTIYKYKLIYNENELK